jgi:hypothetical protein
MRKVAPQLKRKATMTDKEYLPTGEALDYTGRSRSTLYRNLKPARGGFGCIPSLWAKRDLDLLIARYSVEGVGDDR